MTRFEEEISIRQAKAVQRIADTQDERLKAEERIAGHLNDISMTLVRIADSLRRIGEAAERQ